MAAAVAPAVAAAVAPAAVDTLIAMRHVQNISGLANNVDRFITYHSLTSMNDSEYMHHDEMHHDFHHCFLGGVSGGLWIQLASAPSCPRNLFFNFQGQAPQLSSDGIPPNSVSSSDAGTRHCVGR